MWATRADALCVRTLSRSSPQAIRTSSPNSSASARSGSGDARLLLRRARRDEPRRGVRVVHVERLLLEQALGQAVARVAFLAQQAGDRLVGVVDEPLDLRVDQLLGRLGHL